MHQPVRSQRHGHEIPLDTAEPPDTRIIYFHCLPGIAKQRAVSPAATILTSQPVLEFPVGFTPPEQAPSYSELNEPVIVRMRHALWVDVPLHKPLAVPLSNRGKQGQ